MGVSYTAMRAEEVQNFGKLKFFEILYPLRFKSKNCTLISDLNSGPLVYKTNDISPELMRHIFVQHTFHAHVMKT